MAHNIWNGKAIYTGDSAEVWHHIGVYVGDRKLTSAEVLTESGLEYEVKKLPMLIQGPNGETFPSRNFAITRDGVEADPEGEGNPVQMGVVTDNYQILQNADAFMPFDPLVKEGLIEYTAAGALMNGARVWIAAKLLGLKPEDNIVRTTKHSVDTVEAFWLLYNGHDGMTAVNINLTAIRPVCFNTVTAALSDRTFGDNSAANKMHGKETGHTGVKARHARNVNANVAEAVTTLERTHAQFGKLMLAYRAMAAAKLTDARIETFFKRTFPVVDGEEWSTRRKNQIEEMTRLALEGVGNTGGSVWDLFNGVTEWIDHKASDDAMVNVNSSWFGTRKDQRQDAFRAALELVKAA